MKPKVIRNTTNYVSGFVLIGFSIGLFFLNDPWMIWNYASLSPTERMTTLDSFAAMAVFCLIATVGVFFLRLKIEAWPDGSTLVVNPIATWWVGSGQIEQVIEGPLPSVQLRRGPRIWLFGAERSLAMSIMNHQLKHINQLQAVGERGEGSTEVVVSRTFRGTLWYLVPWLTGLCVCVVAILTVHN
ncbi:hypothetical protein [Xylanimonas sp. McL0601]|uniref:hypothetical protein n=1 Tax=Xylanimonas sp. McL0601 TaxID=3414739 RepID=UPI003CEE7FD4